MVIFKGNKRVFDKVIEEENTSTGADRKISIYGVTAYTDIENTLIQIDSSAVGLQQATINVNNLGAKSLKILDNNGLKIDVGNNWVVPGQIYTVIYKDGVFILITQGQGSSSGPQIYTITTVTDLLALTSSSTQVQINDAFNGDAPGFIDELLNGSLVVAQDTNILININYKLVYTSSTLTGAILEFVHNGYYYKQTFVIDNNRTFTTVTVIKSSVENPSITVEDDLTSDSHVNPPSVHAVNNAIGQIDTLLNQILGS